jgi:hypothetical protein
MTALLAGIEQSAFSIWVRESGSVWSYPTIIFLHTVGLALLVGINVAVDLRLLGMMPELPLGPFARLFRIMWAGFWINVVTGLVLLASNATATLLHPAFYVKMGFIAAAVWILVATRRRVFDTVDRGGAIPSSARTLAWLSMVCWLGAITAGRLMTYFAAAPELTTRIGG